MKVLIIGLGSIAQKHIAALRDIQSQVEIIALRSSSNASEIKGVDNIYDHQEIETIKPDFIIVSNPTSEHFSTLNQIADYKIPLFIEKPLFGKAELQEEKLVQKLIRLNIPTYIACNLRFLDALKKINLIIKSLIFIVKLNLITLYNR